MRASFSCAASSSGTVTMVAREMVTSEYTHMLPMMTPAAPSPYFQLAALISSARFRSASRSALAAFFSASTSGSLFGFPAFRRAGPLAGDDIMMPPSPASFSRRRGPVHVTRMSIIGSWSSVVRTRLQDRRVRVCGALPRKARPGVGPGGLREQPARAATRPRGGKMPC